MSAEELRGAVNREIGAQFQRLLIDRGRKGVINDDERTMIVRGRCKPRQVNDFVGRISWTFDRPLQFFAMAATIAAWSVVSQSVTSI